jgi:mono/diheme cytochrome c family protein
MSNPGAFLLNKTTALFCALLVLSWFFFSVSEATAQQGPVIKVKHVAIDYVSPSDGRGMYAKYCASCHGVTGKGDGPAAPAFKHPPTNLTVLATNNGGKFPALLVLNTLKFGPNAPEHGNVQMPVWNNVFRRMHWYSDDSIPQIRTRVLTEYIKTLQAK